MKIIPVSNDCFEYAKSVSGELAANGIRTELCDNASTVSYKIRDAELQKIPYMVIVGKHEVIQGKVAVRKHGTGNVGSLTIEKLATRVKKHDK